ncbi:MAG TPA: hypothetical protein VM912_11865, partial [Terriglobales bacterium]|nr:hypothetical protein [Terriglobales bacterium]
AVRGLFRLFRRKKSQDDVFTSEAFRRSFAQKKRFRMTDLVVLFAFGFCKVLIPDSELVFN